MLPNFEDADGSQDTEDSVKDTKADGLAILPEVWYSNRNYTNDEHRYDGQDINIVEETVKKPPLVRTNSEPDDKFTGEEQCTNKEHDLEGLIKVVGLVFFRTI